jgi:hypothetical protein
MRCPAKMFRGGQLGSSVGCIDLELLALLVPDSWGDGKNQRECLMRVFISKEVIWPGKRRECKLEMSTFLVECGIP